MTAAVSHENEKIILGLIDQKLKLGLSHDGVPVPPDVPISIGQFPLGPAYRNPMIGEIVLGDVLAVLEQSGDWMEIATHQALDSNRNVMPDKRVVFARPKFRTLNR